MKRRSNTINIISVLASEHSLPIGLTFPSTTTPLRNTRSRVPIYVPEPWLQAINLRQADGHSQKLNLLKWDLVACFLWECDIFQSDVWYTSCCTRPEYVIAMLVAWTQGRTVQLYTLENLYAVMLRKSLKFTVIYKVYSFVSHTKSRRSSSPDCSEKSCRNSGASGGTDGQAWWYSCASSVHARACSMDTTSSRTCRKKNKKTMHVWRFRIQIWRIRLVITAVLQISSIWFSSSSGCFGCVQPLACSVCFVPEHKAVVGICSGRPGRPGRLPEKQLPPWKKKRTHHV